MKTLELGKCTDVEKRKVHRKLKKQHLEPASPISLQPICCMASFICTLGPTALEVTELTPWSLEEDGCDSMTVDLIHPMCQGSCVAA